MSAAADRIRVLHVDDDPDFAEMTAAFLRRANDRLSVETVASADEGLARLDDDPPDCVVSDYNMPGMDGIDFLTAVRERYPDLPFVLFTGKGSEDVASDAISSGVTDYLQKGSGRERYELLANRIVNAVEARRDAARAARQEELMRLTEFAGDTGGWELDVTKEELLMTDGTRRLLEVTEDRSFSLGEVMEMYHPDDRPDVQAAVDRAVETGERTRGTWRLRTAAGNERIIEVTMTPVTDGGDVSKLRGSIHDVTEHRERERELETERRFVQQALDALDDLFYVVDNDGTLRRWNGRVPEVTGYSETELAGMTIMEFFPAEHRGRIQEAIDSPQSDEKMTVEADVLTADGERIPYELTGAALTDADGDVTGLVGVGRDLTERRKREERFQAFVEQSSDVISVIDASGRFQYQSPSLEHVLGYSPEETVGELAFEYIHDDDREAAAESFSQGLTEPETRPVSVYRARHADGSWRWMEAHGNNQLDNPAIEGYVINSRDVTERKKRERELRTLKAQYQALVENVPMGVFLFDEDCRYTLAGGDELTAVDLSSDDFEGRRPDDLFPTDIAEELIAYYREALAGRSNTFEQQYQGMTYRIQTLPIRNDDGDIVSGMAVSQNITERREYERKLERRNERLEEFASIVSHDLRNPLTVAEGRLELLEDDCDSEHLAPIADSFDRMEEIIEDTLTLAREGQGVDVSEQVDLGELTANCWANVETAESSLTVEDELTVRGDPTRLRSLFENLFRNAVEHGGGTVSITVGAVDDGGFYVADSGPGIPEADRERVFKPGYSSKERGTGFGLSIVDEIANAHGWEVAVAESDAGGTRFEVTGVELL